MRGFGQIDELARIAEPDVGVITNIGPVHLELVGALAGVARAKAELLAHVPVAIVPADEPVLEPYLREGSTSCASAPTSCSRPSTRRTSSIRARELRVAARGPVHRAPPAREPARRRRRRAGRRRGADRARRRGLRRAARRASELADRRRRHQRLLQRQPALHARRPRRSRHAGASRGDASPCSATCSSSGAGEAEEHRELGAYAASSGVDVLVAVGPLSRRDGGRVRRRGAARRRRCGGGRARRRRSSRPGDVVLVKASRGIGLETVAEALARG